MTSEPPPVAGANDPAPDPQSFNPDARHLSLILNNLSDVIFAVAVGPNDTYRFTSVNRRFLEATGLKENQVVGALVRDVIPESAQPLVFAKYREAIRSGLPARWEEVSVYPTGKKVGHVNIVPLVDPSGRCTHLIGLVHDISDLKQFEERLVESERKYRELVERANSIILRWTRDGTITFLNEFGQRFFGYSAGEIVGRHVLDTIVPPSESGGRDLVALMDRICADPGAFEQNVNENRRRGGERVWVAWTNRIVTNAAGEIAEILSVGSDISDQRAAEAAVRESNERLRLLGDNLPESYVYQYVREPTGPPRFLYLSAGVEKLHGVPMELVLRDARTLLRQIDPEDRPRLFETEEWSRQNLTDFEVEVRCQRPGGEWRWIQLRSRPRRRPDGTVTWDGVATDVTARRQAEDEVRRLNADLQSHAVELERRVAARTLELAAARDRAEAADRTKSAFLATMSHELRTPLNSIIGFTGLLLQGLAGPLNPEQAKQLRMVKESGRHLLALINDVLDISKIEAGQIEIDIAPFDLGEAIQRVVQTVTPLADKKQLAVGVRVDEGLGRVMSDRRRVEQILLNLLSNAIKFTERGHVALSAEASGGGAKVFVSDTGCGIRVEDQGKLFQPFRQLDTGLTRQHEGTGLGLAICRRLAERLGGTISVESEFGRGSTFSFVLPPAPQVGGA